MSFKRSIFSTALIVLLLYIGIVTMRGYAQEHTAISSGVAFQLAQGFLTKESPFIPEWQGAFVLPPKAHYDLEGNISAYVLSLSSPSGKDVGYIAISGEVIQNPILEYSTEPARYTLGLGDLAGATNQGSAIEIDKPLYLGVLAYFYPISNTETLKLVEMGGGDTVEIPNIPVSILQWDDRDRANNESTSEGSLQIPNALSPIREMLYGPDYNWYRGCGPTAVGNVMGFWADRGYPSLVFGGSRGDYRATIDQLAYLMGTSPEGWTWLPINEDIVRFVNLRGYYGFNSHEIGSPGFWQLKDEIDNNRPLTVLVNGHVKYGDHFITMFGYEFDPNLANYQYMMVHDTWGHGDYWVQYGVGYSGIWVDTVNPPQVQLDTIPPTSTVSPLASYQTTNSFQVQWSGVDVGWGIAGYNIQYRDGFTGSWTGWITGTAATTARFSGLRGRRYFFRSSAYDIDHNQESYDEGDGDTNTLVARYILSGKVMTNRDTAVMAAQVSTDPMGLGASLTDGEGEYRVGLMSSGEYTITIEGNSSFGSLPQIKQVPVLDNTSLPEVTLPPSQDFVVNGTFENGLSNWSMGGTVSPTITAMALTGSYALALGENPSWFGGCSFVSQDMTIPLEIDRPTLSFEYQAISYWNPAPLMVSLSGITAITYTISLDSTEWQHAWFDLSEYKGQVIKAEFRVSDSTVRLDDVSIGPASPGVNKAFLPIVSRLG